MTMVTQYFYVCFGDNPAVSYYIEEENPSYVTADEIKTAYLQEILSKTSCETVMEWQELFQEQSEMKVLEITQEEYANEELKTKVKVAI